MNRILLSVGLLALAGPISFAQAAQPATAPSQTNAQSQAQMRVEPGIRVRVELAKTIDAKKAKPGDPVLLKTVDELMSGSHVAAPQGTRILGHVVAATPHHGDSPSTLQIAFDKINLSAENELPMKAVIQALSKPVEAAVAGYGGGMEQPAGGAAPMGQSSGRMGGMQPPTATNPSNGGAGTNTMPEPAGQGTARIPLNADGVIGMSGVSLNADAQGNSTITSQKHNVKLDSGTQMVLKTVQ